MKQNPRYPELYKQAEQQVKASASARDTKTDLEFATAWRYAMLCSHQGITDPFEADNEQVQ